MDKGFPKRERILKRGDYIRIQRRGKRFPTTHFVVIIKPGPGLGWHRLGISAGRKAGNAVRRNRIKRLVREYFRENKSGIFPDYLPGGADIVVVVKRNCPNMSMEQVTKELDGCRQSS